MTAVVLGVMVLAVCGCGLKALAMWLAFKREKLAAEPLVKLSERIDGVEGRLLRVEASALRR